MEPGIKLCKDCIRPGVAIQCNREARAHAAGPGASQVLRAARGPVAARANARARETACQTTVRA
eukprot:11226904-Lingulodinium_polyedra.AAC.1